MGIDVKALESVLSDDICDQFLSSLDYLPYYLLEKVDGLARLQVSSSTVNGYFSFLEFVATDDEGGESSWFRIASGVAVRAGFEPGLFRGVSKLVAQVGLCESESYHGHTICGDNSELSEMFSVIPISVLTMFAYSGVIDWTFDNGIRVTSLYEWGVQCEGHICLTYPDESVRFFLMQSVSYRSSNMKLDRFVCKFFELAAEMKFVQVLGFVRV